MLLPSLRVWQQDGVAKPVVDGVEDAKDGEKDGEGDEEESGADGAEQKAPRRKRRKKYDWDESDWGARAEEEKRLAQEVRKWLVHGYQLSSVVET